MNRQMMIIQMKFQLYLARAICMSAARTPTDWDQACDEMANAEDLLEDLQKLDENHSN